MHADLREQQKQSTPDSTGIVQQSFSKNTALLQVRLQADKHLLLAALFYRQLSACLGGEACLVAPAAALQGSSRRQSAQRSQARFQEVLLRPSVLRAGRCAAGSYC
jgi:hypothetical protein